MLFYDTLTIPEWFFTNSRIHVIMDYKFKNEEKMLLINLLSLCENDVLKFVIDHVSQLEKVKHFTKKYSGKFIITPSYDLINPMEIADKMIKLKLDNVKLGL